MFKKVIDEDTEAEVVYVIFLGLHRQQLRRMRFELILYVFKTHNIPTAEL